MRRNSKVKRFTARLLSLSMIFLTWGCVGIKVPDRYKEQKEEDETDRAVEKATATEPVLKDNMELYGDDDDDVVVMYLTVSKGNSSDSTDHTWKEVNTYSTDYYAEQGIDRYKVNGVLQVGDETGPMPGELGYGRTTPNCTVSVRGQTSSKDPQKGYKIKIKDNQGTWDGQSVLNLNKHEMEGLRFRNKLMYKLQEGLPDMISLRTRFVHLYVKDLTSENPDTAFVDYGLYTHVEQANKKMLKAHGLDSQGYLYKENQMFEFYDYEDIRLATDPLYDEGKFGYYLESKGSNDHSKLKEMLKDVNSNSMDGDTLLDKWFDRNNLSMWMAFNIITGNIDTQSRNTLLYSPSNINKWYFIDWDCDAGLRRYEWALNKHDMSLYSKEAFGWEYGISNYWSNVLFQKILKSEEFRKLLDSKVEYLYKNFHGGKVQRLAEYYAGIVKPYCFGNADKLYEPLTEAEYDDIISKIDDELEYNYSLYKESLNNPMPFYIGKPEVVDGKTVFEWDASYHFGGSEISYEVEVADNFDFKNPIISQQKLFLGQVIYDKKLEPGQYFIKVKAVDAEGNKCTAFDVYYGEEGKIFGCVCFYVGEDGTIRLEGE